MPSASDRKPVWTMQAAAIDRFGPPSVLKLHELPVPEPGPNEVLIALRGAGVGVWDADIRKGWWPSGRPKFPLVLGTDGAGVVAAKGTRVRRFKKGERVWGTDDTLRVRQRETVLVFGATGAVGTMAVQFAKRHGARVIATATGRKATKLVLSLGADASFDARAEDAVDRLHVLAPNGLDAVLAFAGGRTLDRCLDLVKPKGRVAHPNGVEPAPKPRRRRFTVKGYDAEANTKQFARLDRAIEQARLQVPIAAALPLGRAARAHERLEQGKVLGRIVLRIARAPPRSPYANKRHSMAPQDVEPAVDDRALRSVRS